MQTGQCTAQKRGHIAGSAEQQRCPVHGIKQNPFDGSLLPPEPYWAIEHRERREEQERRAAEFAQRIARGGIRGRMMRALLTEDEARMIAKDKNSPSETLRALGQRRQHDYETLTNLASNPSTPPDMLADWLSRVDALESGEGIEDMSRSWGVANPYLMSERVPLDALLGDNPSTPGDAIERRFADGTDEFRMAALRRHADQNPHLSAAAMQFPAHSDVAHEGYNRASLWMASHLGVDLFNQQAIDALLEQEWWTMRESSDEVRLLLALHPNP